MLASYWQFPHSWRSNGRYRKLEIDANGQGTADYELQHSRLFRRQKILKKVEWRPSANRPAETGFIMRSSLRATVDTLTGGVRRIDSELLVEGTPVEHRSEHGFKHEMDG